MALSPEIMTALYRVCPSVAPSREDPGRMVPETPLCFFGFRATRARNARATAAAASSFAASDPNGGTVAVAANVSDRCCLHRNEPGCVVGEHRQYLVLEQGWEAGELMVAGLGTARGVVQQPRRIRYANAGSVASENHQECY
jgi:hypothetical protein